MELRAADVLRYCTGETVEPYDHCPRCGDLHEMRADPNGRFAFMCGGDRAVEVTQVTSSMAEQNRRSWEPYIKERAVPELNLGWHVVFESPAKATYGGRKGHPRFKDALTVISPALAELSWRPLPINTRPCRFAGQMRLFMRTLLNLCQSAPVLAASTRP
ncbi:hypothetical protein STPH2_6474 [Streptomyces sp. KO7888]|nr:hypothetical protein [Streptomyces sp. KO7888]